MSTTTPRRDRAKQAKQAKPATKQTLKPATPGTPGSVPSGGVPPRRAQATVITEAEAPYDEQLRSRRKRYMIMMSMRVPFLIAAARAAATDLPRTSPRPPESPTPRRLSCCEAEFGFEA